MIDIKVSEDDVINQIVERYTQQEASDFMLALTSKYDGCFNRSLIKRFCKRENLRA